VAITREDDKPLLHSRFLELYDRGMSPLLALEQYRRENQKPQIRQAGSAEAFVDPTAAGRRPGNIANA